MFYFPTFLSLICKYIDLADNIQVSVIVEIGWGKSVWKSSSTPLIAIFHFRVIKRNIKIQLSSGTERFFLCSLRSCVISFSNVNAALLLSLSYPPFFFILSLHFYERKKRIRCLSQTHSVFELQSKKKKRKITHLYNSNELSIDVQKIEFT